MVNSFCLKFFFISIMFSLLGCQNHDGLIAGSDGAECVDFLGGQEKASREDVCRLTNAERVKIKTLVLDVKLSAVAQTYAKQMAENGFFSHTNPNTNEGPGERLSKSGIRVMTWGENIALGHGTPGGAMTGWVKSSGHYRNIVNSNFGRLGVGVYKNHWVQVFTN